MTDLIGFKIDMIDLVWQFEAFWEAGHEKVPEDFPMDMSIEEWHEQFIVWLSLEE